MPESAAAPLPRTGQVFFDVRGSSRTMRLSWYADTGVAVFSIWQGDRCTATFRLPLSDLPRMIETLQTGPERPVHPPDNAFPEPGYPAAADYPDAGYRDGGYLGSGYQDAGYPAAAGISQDPAYPATATWQGHAATPYLASHPAATSHSTAEPHERRAPGVSGHSGEIGDRASGHARQPDQPARYLPETGYPDTRRPETGYPDTRRPDTGYPDPDRATTGYPGSHRDPGRAAPSRSGEGRSTSGTGFNPAGRAATGSRGFSGRATPAGLSEPDALATGGFADGGHTGIRESANQQQAAYPGYPPASGQPVPGYPPAGSGYHGAAGQRPGDQPLAGPVPGGLSAGPEAPALPGISRRGGYGDSELADYQVSLREYASRAPEPEPARVPAARPGDWLASPPTDGPPDPAAETARRAAEPRDWPRPSR